MPYLRKIWKAWLARHGSNGLTMVELLVSFAVLSILIGAIAPIAVQSGHYESNVRLLSFARMNLAKDLERLERAVSLAENGSSSASLVLFRFPDECGGVSFETNRVCGVTSLQVSFDGGGINLSAAVAGGDGSELAPHERRLTADPMANLSGVGRYSLTRFSIGTPSPESGLLKMMLSASVPQRRGDGSTYFREITVSRYAKAWNFRQ